MYYSNPRKCILRAIVLRGAATKLFPRVELVTPGDLHTNLCKSTDQIYCIIFNCLCEDQEANLLFRAQIVSGVQQNGWSYVFCTSCSRKLEKSLTSLHFNKRVSPNRF
ncbi:unnamed protein product [Brassica rapa subsp. narinosa]